jgi:hypothetical protein
MIRNNPHSQNNGCMVPICTQEWCNYIKKKICALRREFLLEQIVRRKELRTRKQEYLSEEAEKILKKDIYFWRRIHEQKKTDPK